MTFNTNPIHATDNKWQLIDEELLPPAEKCPLCKSRLILKYYDIFSREGDYYDSVNFASCARADCGYTGKIPPDGE